MDKPAFKNRENIAHKVGDKEVWDSRSGSVNGVVFGILGDNIFVLAEKRSQTMRDEPGKWCVPCGYFDWDEDGAEATIREIYQETGLYLPRFQNQLVFNNSDDGDIQPFHVDTSPKQNRQNLAMSFIFIYDFEKSLPSVDQYKDHEIELVKWIEISEVMSSKYDWAFGHQNIIEKAVIKFEKYLV